jgi:GntR family transcriptional regulator
LPLDKERHTCHITCVTVFRLSFRPGQSIFDQAVYAAKKAFVSGELAPGQPFPSVRSLAAELKIHPNTAHKVVQHLIQERWLEVRPGVGTVVAPPPPARPGDRKRLLQQEVEELVVEAMRIGLDLEELMEAVEMQWQKIGTPEAIRR